LHFPISLAEKDNWLPMFQPFASVIFPQTHEKSDSPMWFENYRLLYSDIATGLRVNSKCMVPEFLRSSIATKS
jgi:hypothetical protein